MTCIIGLVQDNRVHMISDSLGVSEDFSASTRIDKKLFIKDSFLIGFTSSYRMGQLIQYSFTPPARNSKIDLMKYMVSIFVPAIRECFRVGGFSKNINNEESGGCFLVGIEGRLFVIESDFQVGENACGYAAIGCGRDIALGALYTGAALNLTVEEKLNLGISAACEFNTGVRQPFHSLAL